MTNVLISARVSEEGSQQGKDVFLWSVELAQCCLMEAALSCKLKLNDRVILFPALRVPELFKAYLNYQVHACTDSLAI